MLYCMMIPYEKPERLAKIDADDILLYFVYTLAGSRRLVKKWKPYLFIGFSVSDVLEAQKHNPAWLFIKILKIDRSNIRANFFRLLRREVERISAIDVDGEFWEVK